MGNEMGNNNTSELREEEDRKSTETEEKLKEENNVVRAPEDNGKEAGFVDDDPKAVIQTNGKESLSQETEVHFSTESPESEQKLIEESSIATEFQITNSLPEHLEDNSSPNSSNSKDNVSVTSKDEIGNESLFGKEEAEDSAEQVGVVRSEQEEVDMSEPNTAFAVEETSRGWDNHVSDKTEESAAFELVFKEDSRPNDEQFEVENGDRAVEAGILKENDDTQVSIFEETELAANISRNEDSKHADGDSNSEVDAPSNSSEPKENPDGENDEKENPEKNGVLQAEEMNSVHQPEIFPPEPSIESGIHCEWQSSEGPISVDPELINGESEEKGSVKEQTLELEENTEETVLAGDQLPITVTENKVDRIPEESKPEGKLETEAFRFDVKSTSVPAVELPIEKPDEDEAVQLIEPESTEGRITVIQEIHSKQESEENKSLEDGQTLEISEKTEPPEFGEPFKPSFSAFLFHPEDQLQKTATYTEDAQVLKYLTSESKLKTGSEFLKAEALPNNAEATSMESSAPQINQSIATEILEILTETNPSDSENHFGESCNGSVPEISIREKKEDNKTLEIEAKSEKLEIAEAYKPSFPASLLHPEDQQQKAATNSKDNRAFDQSTSEVKLGINSQFLGEPSSPFYTLMETKPEEAEAIWVQTLETPKILTEASPENPEDRLAKYCDGSVPETLTGKRKEDEQTLEIEEKLKSSEFAEEYKLSFPNPLLYPEDQQQKTAANCKDDRVFSVSTSEVKLESNSELTSVPSIDLPTGNTEEAGTNPSGSENHSKKSSNRLIPGISNEDQKETLADEKLPDSNGESEGETEKVKTLTPDNKEQEPTARFSIESNSESYISQAEMRKSPSFGPDLRIEAAKPEESEQTPLLCQNKSTNQEAVNPRPVPPEEKAIALEKSNSNKLKLPFLAEPKQQDKQVKDKHRRRSSLFTNCMCCTTVLN